MPSKYDPFTEYLKDQTVTELRVPFSLIERFAGSLADGFRQNLANWRESPRAQASD